MVSSGFGRAGLSPVPKLLCAQTWGARGQSVFFNGKEHFHAELCAGFCWGTLQLCLGSADLSNLQAGHAVRQNNADRLYTRSRRRFIRVRRMWPEDKEDAQGLYVYHRGP